MERIQAQRMIPGRGQPVDDAVVVLDGPTISYAGPGADAPATPDATVTSTETVMPGLWDCHGHFLGARTASLTQAVLEPGLLQAMRVAQDARAALDAGFTSVREAGGFGVYLATAVEEGTVLGPSVYAPGAILSTSGGHGDVHDLPVEWVHELSRTEGLTHLADGVDECIRAVRLQLRRNARVIKVCASGGVMSEIDDPIHQQFRADELAAIVETAGMADRVVMAHCHGRPGIVAALQAGVRTIEHGTYLDEETCAMMREADALLVPTRYIVERLVAVGRDSGMTAANLRKLEAVSDRHLEAVGMAHEHGVRIALGTDIFMTGSDRPVAWGQNGAELALMVRAGLSPLEAIEAATANAPDTLGPQAPRSGQLVAGHDADVITVDGNPLDDMALLGDPGRITGVWKAGTRVKPLADPRP